MDKISIKKNQVTAKKQQSAIDSVPRFYQSPHYLWLIYEIKYYDALIPKGNCIIMDENGISYLCICHKRIPFLCEDNLYDVIYSHD